MSAFGTVIKNGELFEKAKANAQAYQAQTTDDKMLMELKKIAIAQGKNSFTRPYTMAIRTLNDSAAPIVSPNYNIEVPAFQYPVSVLRSIRSKWTRSVPVTGLQSVNHQLRIFPISSGGSQALFDVLEPTRSAPSPIETEPAINPQFSLYYYNDSQSNNGFESGMNIILPPRIGFFFVPIITTTAYTLAIGEADMCVVDLLIEHSLTPDFKP